MKVKVKKAKKKSTNVIFPKIMVSSKSDAVVLFSANRRGTFLRYANKANTDKVLGHAYFETGDHITHWQMEAFKNLAPDKIVELTN